MKMYRVCLGVEIFDFGLFLMNLIARQYTNALVLLILSSFVFAIAVDND